MSLPAAWVDSLFARLTIRYGAAFMRQYADLDAEAVKADWADVLGPMEANPQALRYGLENLPADKPPNAMQFRAICNRRPDKPVLAIAHEARPEPEKVAALVARIPREPATDHRAWARRLRDIEMFRGGELPNGQQLTGAQRAMWRTALAAEQEAA